MKTKKGFLLRKMANEYMVIAIGSAADSLNGLIRLNETGAFYWRLLEKGATKEELLDAAEKEMEDFDRSVADEDLEEFIKSIEFAIDKP